MNHSTKTGRRERIDEQGVPLIKKDARQLTRATQLRSKKRAATLEYTMSAGNPCKFRTLTGPANPGIFEWYHSIGHDRRGPQHAEVVCVVRVLHVFAGEHKMNSSLYNFSSKAVREYVEIEYDTKYAASLRGRYDEVSGSCRAAIVDLVGEED